MKREVLWDLDDTLIDTKTVFEEPVKRAKEVLSRRLEIDEQIIDRNFEIFVAKAYQTVGVVPELVWGMTLGRLGMVCGFGVKDGVWEETVEEVKVAYMKAPERFEETEEVLEGMEREEWEMWVVSHGGAEWSGMKMEKAGLGRFFGAGRRLFAEPIMFRHKDEAVWRWVIEKTGVDPKEAWVVEDNLGSIRAAVNVGFANVIWVNRGKGWKVFRSGPVPAGVKEVKNLREAREIMG